MYVVARTSKFFQPSTQKSAKEKYLSNNITYGVMEVYSRYFEYECSCSKYNLLCVPTTLTNLNGEAPYVMTYRNMDSMFMVVCTTLMILYSMGHAVVQLVDALCYEPESQGFNSRWCHWNLSLT